MKNLIQDRLPPLKPSSRRYVLAGAAVLVTLATFGWALYLRQHAAEYPPLSLADLVAFKFEPYVIGFSLQELAIPLVLIYILSSTALFRRAISSEASRRDKLRLFGALVVIQLLALNYSFGLLYLLDDQATSGVLIVIAGGLMGGWRMGLGLGLVTMLVQGTQKVILYPEDELLSALRDLDWRVLLKPALWIDLFLWRYLLEMEVLVAIWAGVVAGLCGDLMGERRFAPGPALALGIGVELGAGYLIATSWEDPASLTSYLLPMAAVSGLVLAVMVLVVRNVQAQAARQKAAASELARAEAELRALRAQINPHFFFNALNTIRYFTRTDPETARRLLLNLSEVFQQVLRSGDYVPLRDELGYARAYLALESARLGERLRVEWAITAEHLLDQPVPTLVLQPIVENAVVHGIASQSDGGTLRIAVEESGGDLLLRVEDDGPGIEPEQIEEVLTAGGVEGGQPLPKKRPSIGLRNVDGRLRALYGQAYGLTLDSQVGRGTSVQIAIPIGAPAGIPTGSEGSNKRADAGHPPPNHLEE